jgi:predicted nucleic acid-binding protein
MIRVYLDTCCLNRPLDDQSQDRVRLESEAVVVILRQVARGEWTLIGSSAIDDEIAAIRDQERQEQVQEFARTATEHIRLTADCRRRGLLLERMGFKGYDSVHIACAEAAVADVLLTTDDAFVRRARRLRQDLRVHVANPLTWLKERQE